MMDPDGTSHFEGLHSGSERELAGWNRGGEDDIERAQLLDFLSPGIVHALGNAVFVIQGHGRLLGSNGLEVARPRQGILQATDRVAQTLDFYRAILGERGRVRGQAGILLRQAADVLRVPLREQGLVLDYRHGARSTPVVVEAWDVFWSVSFAVRALLDEVPVGFVGVIAVDLVSQDPTAAEIGVALEPQSSLLPFPVKVGQLCADLTRRTSDAGIVVRPAPGGVRLRLRPVRD